MKCPKCKEEMEDIGKECYTYVCVKCKYFIKMYDEFNGTVVYTDGNFVKLDNKIYAGKYEV
jgi:hypothetical protein